MNKISLLIVFIGIQLLFTNLISAQLENNETKEYKNSFRITPSYTGADGLSFKINYEKNIGPRLIVTGSYETIPNNFHAFGLGLKYRTLGKNTKFEHLIGPEVFRSISSGDNSTVNTNTYGIKLNNEFRYNISKRVYLSADTYVGYNFTNNKSILGFGLGGGFRF